jgi:hypothetical protein
MRRIWRTVFNGEKSMVNNENVLKELRGSTRRQGPQSSKHKNRILPTNLSALGSRFFAEPPDKRTGRLAHWFQP